MQYEPTSPPEDPSEEPKSPDYSAPFPPKGVPYYPYGPYPPYPYPPRKNRSWVKYLLILMVPACIGCLAAMGILVHQIWGAKDDAEAVIDAFMIDMKGHNVAAARQHFSDNGLRNVTFNELQDMLEGSNYALFEHYSSLRVTTWYVSRNTSGTSATIRGSLHYTDGYTGSFSAVMEHEDGEWKIQSINITVPPSKMRGFRSTPDNSDRGTDIPF